ncbi:MAG: hypothetical protein KY476_15665 [Planctomycetes bacterium]|nr:hypothetical protein [Planctomycetota bacterium]
MPFLRRLLLAVGLLCAVVSLTGCGDKETVREGSMDEVKQKFPAPPDQPNPGK